MSCRDFSVTVLKELSNLDMEIEECCAIEGGRDGYRPVKM
jgi:hypothetical protein